MGRILIAYGSIEGQTEKIARRLAACLEGRNHAVSLENVKDSLSNVDLSNFDGVIVGAPVHAAGYPRRLKKWIRIHADGLNGRASAFFSVCLGILQKDDPKVQADERRIALELFRNSGWEPGLWTIFAGGLPYSKYGWAKKRVMRAIVRRAGVDTDLSKDYEYTDWNDVARFALEFDRLVPGLAVEPRVRRQV